MIRNNAISLFFQIPLRISLIFFSFVIGFDSSLIHSEQERVERNQMLNNKIWFIFFSVLIMYFILGFLLPNNGSKLKNLLSVSSLFFIGLFIGSMCFIELTFTHNTIFGNILEYLYSLDFPFLKFDNRILNFQYIFAWILEILIPSLFIWLGLETRVTLLKLIRLFIRTNHEQS